MASYTGQTRMDDDGDDIVHTSEVSSMHSDEEINENDVFNDEESSNEYLDVETNENDDLAAAASASKRMSYVETARMFKLRRNLDQLDCFRRQKECDILNAREELKLLQQNIQSLQTHKEKLEKEIEGEKAGESSVALFRLQAQHRSLHQELQRETEIEAQINTELKQRELDLSELEVELGRFSSIQQELYADEQAFQRIKTQKAKKRLQQERKASHSLQLKMQQLENQQAVMDFSENERKIKEERTNRKTAVKFLKESIRRVHQEEAEKEQQKSMIIEKRINAVKTLKSSIAATHESMQVQLSRPKVSAQKKEQQNQQKESPQAQGINNGSRRQKQLQLQQKQVEFEWQRSNRVKIVTKMLPQQQPIERKRSQKEVIKLKLETTGKFLENRLKEKLWCSLDPGPVSASKQVDRIYSESSSSSDSSDLEEAHRSEVDHQLVNDCLAEPEFPGLWEQKYETPSHPKLAPISLTQNETPATPKLNLSMKNLCEPILKGTSFLSKPEVVLFTDFEVGETYPKKVILTNSSSLSNNCRLLGVSAPLRDFITISFKMPGPLSSGMSCDFIVTFQPKINKDMEGEILFAAAAGPFSVPVRCTTKKCEVQVDSQTVDFGSQLVGQNISRTITLTNKGALATHFHLDMSSCVISETQHVQMSSQTPGDSGSMILPSVRSKEVNKLRHDLCEVSQENILACLPSNVDPQTEESSGECCDIHLGSVKEGKLEPFGRVKLDFYFTPSFPGENRLDFRIVFSDPNSSPIPIKVMGLAVTLPVWVTQPSINFKICMFDHLYQERIQIESRASTALKLTFEVCQEMRKHMEVLPKTGCILAQSHFNAHLKFLPRSSLSRDAGKYFDKNTGVLEVPLRVQVENQLEPMQVTVQAVVTTSDLEFEPTEVDFGCCSVDQSIRSTLRLTNLSLLSQEFGFVGVPEFVDVQPNDGFGTLLPQETLEIDLIFSAEKIKEYNFQLTCKTTTNREFPLTCRAVGVHPPLQLSHSLVHFGATALGDESTALLYLSNHCNEKSKQLLSAETSEAINAASARLFSFCPPSDSPLRISPSAGRLLPGEQCLVQVTFSPRLLYQDIQDEAVRLIQQAQRHSNEVANKNDDESQVVKTRGKKLSASSKTSKVSDTSRTDSEIDLKSCDLHLSPLLLEEARLSLLKSFNQSFTNYRVPCFVSDSETPTQDGQVQPEWSLSNTLYLDLLCPVIQPPLVVIPNNRNNAIEFQHVAVGERVLQSLALQNISNDTIKIWSSLLDLCGPFTLLNTLKELKPGQQQTLTFAFCPTSEKKFCEILAVHCWKMALEITLRGEGVVHKVSWSHPGGPEGPLDFGYVLEKESASRVVTLQNASSFAVDFVMLLSSIAPSDPQSEVEGLLGNLRDLIVGTQNYNGCCAFSVNPMQGTIQAGASQDVTITFEPDQPSLHYSDRLTVQTSNQSKLCEINLKGAASSHHVYVRGGERLTVPVRSLIPPQLTFSGLQLEESQEATKSGIPVLVLLHAICTQDRVQPAVRELQVGCIKSKRSNKRGAEFILEDVESLEEQGFTVEPSRGSVAPGQSSIITITWTPQNQFKPNDMVQMWVRLTVIGEETVVYNVTLMAQVLPQ
ncbi:cilia- and flagella-associated protein 74-like isoform X2 [Synchiropus splendidus]|uniref:cilia- and flagella-associated protein 74-like isoform X2 n=1 Tax=Synchiropus splendidus TaxID=270530 RepID=UPI00237E89F8|nr:cilia- and flagella-associated protein 74-like isoform X2 [Synchiropus splendidus]